MNERRKEERVQRDVSLRIKEYVGGKVKGYRTIDVSSSGAFLAPKGLFSWFKRECAIGETILVHYPIPGSNNEIRVEGEVVRVVDKNATKHNSKLTRGIGVNFLRTINVPSQPR